MRVTQGKSAIPRVGRFWEPKGEWKGMVTKGELGSDFVFGQSDASFNETQPFPPTP